MNPTLITAIVATVTKVVQAALASSASFKEALAMGLEDAAYSIRAGDIQIDDAVARAVEDQAAIDTVLDTLPK